MVTSDSPPPPHSGHQWSPCRLRHLPVNHRVAGRLGYQTGCSTALAIKSPLSYLITPESRSSDTPKESRGVHPLSEKLEVFGWTRKGRKTPLLRLLRCLVSTTLWNCAEGKRNWCSFCVGLQTAEVQPLCIISTEIQDGRSIRLVCLCIEKSSIHKVHSFGHRVVSVGLCLLWMREDHCHELWDVFKEFLN